MLTVNNVPFPNIRCAICIRSLSLHYCFYGYLPATSFARSPIVSETFSVLNQSNGQSFARALDPNLHSTLGGQFSRIYMGRKFTPFL